MRVVGRLDREIYKVVTPEITTDEVVITEERIQHIRERHPGDYEAYGDYLSEALIPDYIIEANRPYSAVVLKKLKSEGVEIKLILRLQTSSDPSDFKNSIISFMRIDEKTWKSLLRCKKILYKRE